MFGLNKTKITEENLPSIWETMYNRWKSSPDNYNFKKENDSLNMNNTGVDYMFTKPYFEAYGENGTHSGAGAKYFPPKVASMQPTKTEETSDKNVVEAAPKTPEQPKTSTEVKPMESENNGNSLKTDDNVISDANNDKVTDYSGSQAKKQIGMYDDVMNEIGEYMYMPLIGYLLGGNTKKGIGKGIVDRWNSRDKSFRNIGFLLNQIGTSARNGLVHANPVTGDHNFETSAYDRYNNEMFNRSTNRINNMKDKQASDALSLVNKGFTNVQDLKQKVMDIINTKGADARSKQLVLEAMEELGSKYSGLTDEQITKITEAMLLTSENKEQAITAAIKAAGMGAVKAFEEAKKDPNSKLNSVLKFLSKEAAGRAGASY